VTDLLTTAPARIAGVAVFAVLTLCSVGVSVAAAEVPGAAAAQSDAAHLVASTAAGKLASIQQRSGGWADPIARARPSKFRDSYGDGVTGAALVEIGNRQHQRSLMDSGLRAIKLALTSRQTGGSKAESNKQFIDIALADAWPYASAELRRRRNSSLRSRWLARLRSIPYVPISSATSVIANEYANRRFLQAMLVLRVCSLQLGTGRPGTILGSCSKSKQFAVDIIQRASAIQGSGTSPALLTDPPTSPLAYNGLIAASLARSLAWLPAGQSAAVATRLGRALRAAALLQAPDGDVAWAGRSNEQPWVLAGTAFAARRWGRIRGRSVADAKLAARLDGLSIGRLKNLHLSAERAFDLTPAFKTGGFSAAISDLDGYASSSSYAGLTLLFTAWAAEAGRLGSAAGTSSGPAAIHGPGATDTGVVRTSNVWAGLSGGTIAAAGHDPRRSAGLLRLKVRVSDGRWVDVISGVPRLSGTAGIAHPGPTVWTPSVVRFSDKASLATDAQDGSVVMTFQLAQTKGYPTAKGLVARFTPVACGLRITLPAAGGGSPRFAFNVPGTATTTGSNVSWASGSLTAAGGESLSVMADRGTSLVTATSKVAIRGAAEKQLQFTITGAGCS